VPSVSVLTCTCWGEYSYYIIHYSFRANMHALRGLPCVLPELNIGSPISTFHAPGANLRPFDVSAVTILGMQFGRCHPMNVCLHHSWATVPQAWDIHCMLRNVSESNSCTSLCSSLHHGRWVSARFWHVPIVMCNGEETAQSFWNFANEICKQELSHTVGHQQGRFKRKTRDTHHLLTRYVE
jgi:hypothetical protein